MKRHPITEIGVSALIILICVVFWVQASRMPPGSFEPLGSGPVPMYTASIVILCCVIVIARAVAAVAGSGGFAKAFREEFSGNTPIGGYIMLGSTVCYVGALHLKLASFGVITFVFLTFLIWSMERFNLRKVPLILIIAAVFAFGAEYLFTNVFVVDLPT